MQNLTPQLLGTNLERIPGASACVLEPSLKGKIRECITLAGNFKNPIVVSDETLLPIWGEDVTTELGIQFKLILSAGVTADLAEAERVAGAAAGSDLIIAVGSGTINDICKYAAHLMGIPYVVFATAPSMNGYVSATASLIKDGLKTSHAAKMPLAAFFDLGILSAAPYRLIRAGIGDTLCRSVVQADWLVSHLLIGTKYDETPFTILKPYENLILQKAALFPKRDAAAIEALMKALIIGGFGMVMCGGSYPASQGEHTIAHALEMCHPEIMHKSYHGEQIAVTSLYMEGLQRMILSLPHLPDCKPLPTGGEPYPEYTAKIAHFSKAEKHIQSNWQQIKQKIESVLLTEGQLEAAMKAAELPMMPADIGLTNGQLLDASAIAPLLRNRFGFLDLQFKAEN